jgi:ribonucleoside-diphosphate reductase alpha chain
MIITEEVDMQSTTGPQPAHEANGHATLEEPDDQVAGGTQGGSNLIATLPGNRDCDYSPPRAVRSHLPDERVSITHKFSVGGHEGYITVGLYPDHQPGEIFITMAKEGSTVSGLISSFAQALSIALQHGVPLKLFCDKFSHTRFEPSGWTGNPEIGQASSVMDYIFRWLRLRFCGEIPTGMVLLHPLSSQTTNHAAIITPIISAEPAQASDTPTCPHCGSLTKRNGSCYICGNCGSTTGCS